MCFHFHLKTTYFKGHEAGKVSDKKLEEMLRHLDQRRESELITLQSKPWKWILTISWIWPNGIIFHQPRFPWNKGISLTKPPFGVRSCEVAIIWPVKWFFGEDHYSIGIYFINNSKELSFLNGRWLPGELITFQSRENPRKEFGINLGEGWHEMFSGVWFFFWKIQFEPFEDIIKA